MSRPEPRDWANWVHRNPRLLVLAVALALVAGLSSYVVMPRMEDPPLANRAAQISTVFPGADPARVEALVTEKLEEQLQEIEEIKEFRSTSSAGISVIAVELRDDVSDVDPVWSRVRDKLADAAPLLPREAAPEFLKLDIKAYALIVALRWSRDDSPNYAVLRRQAKKLEDRLRALPATEKVRQFGDPREEIRVLPRPEELTARGLTVDDVARQLAASDAKVSAGQVRGNRGDLLLQVDSELSTIARIGRTPIRFGAEGRFVQLADIAEIEKAIADPPGSLAVVAGRRSVALGAYVRSDARIDRWSRDVRRALDEFAAELPAGIEHHLLLDQSQYVEARLSRLLGNLLLGGAAVVGVILLLMGWSSAMIVAVSLALSALLVLAGLRLLGIPIHQMSVTGLIIALGLLIDNAIVMVDEVGERLREGKPAGAAVSLSVRRMAVPLLGSTLTTALAFGPIALMPGPAGEFVGSIGVSVILAIASSFLLAMTVVPAFAARGIRYDGRGVWQRGFTSRRLASAYRRTLETLFRRPAWGIALGLALPLLGFIQARHLPEQFFPPADRDQFHIEVELPAGASLQRTTEVARQIRRHVLRHEQVADVHWFLGESAPSFYYNLIPSRKGAARYAQALVQLSTEQGSLPLIRRLQRELDAAFPEARVLVRQLEQGPPFNAPLELRLYGEDIAQLRKAGDRLRTLMASSQNVIHTRAEISEALPQLSLQLDEEQIRLAGLDHRAVAGQLNSALDGALGGTVLESTEELPVRVRLPRSDRSTLEQLESLDLLGAASAAESPRYAGVPLTAVARARLKPELAGIPHFNGRRVNEVQGFVKAGTLPAEALSSFQQKWRQSGYELPAGISFQWGGEAAKRDDAVGNLMANVGVLTVLMAATLVLSFRSFRLAALIASVAALAVGLGLGALWAFGYPFGFMAIVGTMGLVGVAINDAIVVLASIRGDDAARTGDPDAVTRVVVQSTRHIVATSLTTMAGFAPLVIAGGGFWPPLAVAIAGGVGGATVLALYYVPSLYIVAMCPSPCPLRRAAQDREKRDVRLNGRSPAAEQSQQPAGLIQTLS